jgi:hypothetical protein
VPQDRTPNEKLAQWRRHGLTFHSVKFTEVRVNCNCGFSEQHPSWDGSEEAGNDRFDAVSLRLWGRPHGPPPGRSVPNVEEDL